MHLANEQRTSATALGGEQRELEQVANATIASLKELVDEKNRTIDRYKRKLDEARTQTGRGPNSAREAEQLVERMYRENDEFIARCRAAALQAKGGSADPTQGPADLMAQLQEILWVGGGGSGDSGYSSCVRIRRPSNLRSRHHASRQG